MFPKNPLTMWGRIVRCFLFTYQTPASEAARLLPRPLELVTRDGCAFWNVVVCEIRQMRPKPLPAFVGVSYRHVAYRLYARFRPATGESIEGLYFLRSDCDSPLMTGLGNLLTDFNFHTARVEIEEQETQRRLTVASPDAPAQALLHMDRPPRLPAHSVFDSLDEAAAFLKYKPFGLSPVGGDQVNVVKIVRDEAVWKSRLVEVAEAEWKFFAGKMIRPEICYAVEPIFYQWNRGRLYRSSPEGKALSTGEWARIKKP